MRLCGVPQAPGSQAPQGARGRELPPSSATRAPGNTRGCEPCAGGEQRRGQESRERPGPPQSQRQAVLTQGPASSGKARSPNVLQHRRTGM